MFSFSASGPSVCLLIAATLLLSARPASADSIDLAVAAVPETANALAVVRVSEILKSPYARAQGLAQKQQDLYAEGSSLVPPWIDLLVVGAHVQPDRGEKLWTVGIFPKSEQVTFALLAGKIKSEMVGSITLVAGRNDATTIDLSEGLIGFMTPSARQDAIRWARGVQAGTTGPSPYLKEAAGTLGHVVCALDMQDMISPHKLAAHLSVTKDIGNNRELIEQFVRLGTGIRGVRFVARIEKTITANLVLDFSSAPGAEAVKLVTLVRQVIGDSGFHLDELDDCQVNVEANSLILHMPSFSEESLRRVLSLIMTRAPELAPAEPGSNSTTEVADVSARRNNRYFDAVNKVLDDLDRANKRAKDYTRTASWHDSYAKKIEDLQTAGVDPKYVDYGATAAQRLRALAASLRGVAVELDAQQGALVYNASVQPGYIGGNVWGGYGYQPSTYNWSSNLEEVRGKQAEAVAAGSKQRDQIWLLIQNDRAAMTRDIQERYPLRRATK